jgi:5-formyltetrahydrofolate cyclo-ligase
MTKKEARLYFREQRKQLGHHLREKYQDLLLIRFQQLRLPFIGWLHAYLPMHDKVEPDPEPLVRSLEFSNPGLCLAVPRIISDTEMVHIRLTEQTELRRNEYGILEPLEGEALDPQVFDLVLVPLLGFDLQGQRVGYGKGYYDRFLASCREDVIKVGLSFFGPVNKIHDTAEWDIPLDYCITPEMVYEF